MNTNTKIILVILLIALFVYVNYYYKENYSSIVYRIPNSTKNKNTCEYPLTNTEKNTYCDKFNSVYQYGERPLITPDGYLDILKKLVKEISLNKVIDDKIVIDDYDNDNHDYNSVFIKHLNEKLQNLIQTKNYLQNNGTWKYESLIATDPYIYSSNKNNMYKVVFTLSNPQRSAYTKLYCIVKTTDNFESINSIEYMNFVNTFEELPEKSIDNTKRLEFKFVNQLNEIDFDKYAHPITEENLNDKIIIKADIPTEFKD